MYKVYEHDFQIHVHFVSSHKGSVHFDSANSWGLQKQNHCTD